VRIAQQSVFSSESLRSAKKSSFAKFFNMIGYFILCIWIQRGSEDKNQFGEFLQYRLSDTIKLRDWIEKLN